MSGLDPNADTPFADGLEPAEPEPTSADFASGLEPAEGQRASLASSLETSSRLAADKDPASHANVLRMADYLKMDPAVVERNPAEVKSVVAQRQVNLDSLIEHSPVLASWLAIADNMAVARDDIKGLQGLEWWFGRARPSGEAAFSGSPRMEHDEGAMSRAVKVGIAQRERSELGWQMLLSGADPTSNPRVGELDSYLAEDYGKESHGTFGRMATGTLELLAPMVTGALSGAAMGAEAGGLAALAGPGAPVTVPVATSAGTFAGIGYDTLKQEAGAAYFDIVEAMKERGGAVNYRAAAGASAVVGAANAAIEIGGSKLALEFFPFLKPLFGEAAPKFGGVTLKKAVAKAVAGYLATLAEETGTEVAQQAVTSLGRESAVGATGGRTDIAQIPGELGTEGVESGLSMALLIVPGATGQAHSNFSAARQGKQAQARLEQFGAIAHQMRLAETSPEAMAAFVTGAAEKTGHPESVLVSADAWTTLFQGKGMSPAAAATQIGIGAEYANAKETGGFVAIPFGTYATEIATNTEYNAALAPDAKFYQESMTGREAEEYEKVLQKLPESMGEETEKAATRSPIYQERFDQLTAIGVSEADADHYARLHEAFVKTQAARTGLTDEDVATIFPLAIEAGDITVDENGAATITTPSTQTTANKVGSLLGLTQRTGVGHTITLSPSANRSTFLNETGHYFLDSFSDLAYRDESTDQTRADYESLLTWFGVKTRDQVTGAHHEKFARAFEDYLQEGKAPSLELVRPFARFAAWLKSIYRQIVGRGGLLTDEVRGVMDRMIATDDQIANVRQSSAYVPMFKSAEEAGMSEDKFASYTEKATAAHAQAQEALGLRIASDQRRETEGWWKEERAKAEEEIAARVNAERQVQAYRYLSDGVLPEGADPQVYADESGNPHKLSLDVIDSDYPGLAQTVRKEFGRTGTTAKGGVHPDFLGALFGYPSGSEFLQAVTTMAPPDSRIARETRNTMIERHGDVLHDGTLPQATEEAVRDSKALLSQMLDELDALNRKAGHPRVRLTQADLAASAFASIREGKVRDLDPEAFQRAERTAATNAIKANKKGKYDEAVEWQRRRLLNFALAREAAKAKKESDSAAKFLANSNRDATRAKLGKAGGTYQAQQDELLARFDFRKRSLKAIDKSERLAEWVEAQRVAGFDPVISGRLLDEAFRTNWKNLSVNDLLGLRDAVKSIQHTADVKNSLLIAGKERAFEAVKTDALDSLRSNTKDPGGDTISETLGGVVRTAGELSASFDAFNVRLEEVALQMDGGNPNGVFSQMLVHSFADAQTADKDLGLDVAAKLLKLYEALPEADRKAIQTGKVYIKSIKQTLTMRDVLGVAANYGNASNYSKLLGGYQTEQVGLIPWTPEVIEEILDHMTEAQWDYIQEGGNILQGLWPASSALEQRLTGIAPPEIERKPFTRKFPDGRTKTYPGYYYPVIPHPKFSKLMAEQMSSPDGGPYEAWHTRAMTPHGHLVERTGAQFPISLNIMRMPGHVAQVIHDTTHREAVINAWRFLTDPEIAAEIKHRVGLPHYRMMLERVRRIANARGMLDYDGDWLGWGEAQLAASLMGWKVTTATQNFANVAVAKTAVGAVPFAQALGEFRRDPKGTLELIHSLSGEMKHRFSTRDNETRREFERAVVGESWDAVVRRTGYYMASFTNALVDNPAWLAAYRTELKNGATSEAAARTADSVIRTNFGAGGVKDLALYQDSPLWKHLTMFTGWFSSQYNAERRIIRETRGIAAEGRYVAAAQHLIVDNFWRIAVMAVASELLSGRAPKDGEKTWEWVIAKIMLYQAALIPGLKEISAAVDFGSDPRFGGIGSLGKLVSDAWKADVKAAKARSWDSGGKALSANAKLLGTLKGWPAAQAEITGGYLKDLATGKAHPTGVGNFLHDLLFRRDKKRRR